MFTIDRVNVTSPITESVTELIERARSLTVVGERRILGITGTPGAGKSRLCAHLGKVLGDGVALVSMDGFHLSNDELIRLGRRDRKGAPDTFDVEGYVALLSRLRTQRAGSIYAPTFDRAREETVGSAVAVSSTSPLVITEGNYLLFSEFGWAAVTDQLDEVWYLDIEPEERGRRLIARRHAHGEPTDSATSWVQSVDEINARLVETTRDRADLIVRIATEQGVQQ